MAQAKPRFCASAPHLRIPALKLTEFIFAEKKFVNTNKIAFLLAYNMVEYHLYVI